MIRGAPRTTLEQAVPGAFDGETISRRRFMTGSVHAIGAVAGAAVALPAIGFALGPVFARQGVTWQDVGAVSDFTETTFRPVTISIAQGIGEAGRSTAYVRRHNADVDPAPKDSFDRFVALSTRCAHVGCPVRYIPSSEEFICPCHGGVYDFRGVRIGGPPPRPLDRFYTAVRRGRLLLGPRYSLNLELRRFSPRDPGEPLDGIGQYLYPPRFSTAPVPPPPPAA